VYTFGCGDKGQLGHGDLADRHAPTLVASGALAGDDGATAVTSISAGGAHTMAVAGRRRGEAVVWGRHAEGRLGLGTVDAVTEDVLVPTIIPSLSEGMAAVSAGRYHSCLLALDGSVWSCGSNQHGQLGLGNKGKGTERWVPERVGGIAHVRAVQVCAGRAHGAALMEDGAVWTWGKGGYGRLGHGDEDERLVPTRVAALDGDGDGDGDGDRVGTGSRVVRVSVGDGITMAVTQGGKLFVWGDGQASQHFLGDTDSRLVPTQVGGALDGATVVDVSGGAEHSLVSLDDGTVWGCGARGNGRLGVGSENGRLGIDEGEKEGEGTKLGSLATVVMIPGVGALAKETDYGVALVEIPIVPGKLQDAFSLFTEHPHGLKYTATQPGFLSMTVALDATKNSVVLLEKWEKKEDWTAYEATRRAEEGELGASNAAWGAEFGPLVGGAPRMVSMDCEKHYEKEV
jgi:alpha-tubulin suppressor-like RCC1 family protein